MQRLLLLLALLGAAAPSPLDAQSGLPLAEGARVRVTVPTIHGWMVGTVQQVDSEALVLNPEGDSRGDTLRVPLEMLQRVEVSRGHEPSGKSAAQGARNGFLAGAGAGAVMGVLLAWGEQGAAEIEKRDDDVSAAMYAAKGGLALGLAGAAAGVVLGSRATERWEPVVMPARGGVTVSVSVAR